MSTRANIKVTDSYGDTLWFYRHSDGYPEGALPTLSKFMKALRDGKIRNNAGQSAGWLIVLGHDEYVGENLAPSEIGGGDEFMGWKVGSIEPTTQQHGDIEFLYTIDLDKKTLTVKDIYADTEKEIDIL